MRNQPSVPRTLLSWSRAPGWRDSDCPLSYPLRSTWNRPQSTPVPHTRSHPVSGSQHGSVPVTASELKGLCEAGGRAFLWGWPWVPHGHQETEDDVAKPCYSEEKWW